MQRASVAFLTLLAVLLSASCVSSHVKGHRSAAADAKEFVQTYLIAHGADLDDYRILFDSTASLEDRMREANQVLRKAFVDLESTGNEHRLDFLVELSMNLSVFLVLDAKDIQ